VLAVLFGIPVWLTWREVRQERLNQALYDAVEKHDFDSAHEALARGADPNARDHAQKGRVSWRQALARLLHRSRESEQGDPALGIAACTGDTKLTTLLLDHGADINIKSDLGRTPLIWAAMCAEPDTVEILLRRGADVTPREKYGRTALQWAEGYGYKRIIHLIKAAGG